MRMHPVVGEFLDRLSGRERKQPHQFPVMVTPYCGHVVEHHRRTAILRISGPCRQSLVARVAGWRELHPRPRHLCRQFLRWGHATARAMPGAVHVVEDECDFRGVPDLQIAVQDRRSATRTGTCRRAPLLRPASSAPYRAPSRGTSYPDRSSRRAGCPADRPSRTPRCRRRCADRCGLAAVR